MKILKKLKDFFRLMKPNKTIVQEIINDIKNNPNTKWKITIDEWSGGGTHSARIFKILDSRKQIVIKSQDFLGDTSWNWYSDKTSPDYQFRIGIKDSFRLMFFMRKHIKETRKNKEIDNKQLLLEAIKG